MQTKRDKNSICSFFRHIISDAICLGSMEYSVLEPRLLSQLNEKRFCFRHRQCGLDDGQDDGTGPSFNHQFSMPTDHVREELEKRSGGGRPAESDAR